VLVSNYKVQVLCFRLFIREHFDLPITRPASHLVNMLSGKNTEQPVGNKRKKARKPITGNVWFNIKRERFDTFSHQKHAKYADGMGYTWFFIPALKNKHS